MSIPPLYALDDLQYYLQNELAPIEARWQNITNKKPYYISPLKEGGTSVNLRFDEEIVLRLNEDSIFRIHTYDTVLNPEQFEVKVSNGSGLYQIKKLLKSENSNDLLLNIDDYSSVVRISWKDKLKISPEISFFASYYETIPQFIFYPDKPDLSTNGSRFLRVNDSITKRVDYQLYNEIKPSSPIEFSIIGPARIEVLTLYAYDLIDSGKSFPYNVIIEMDGRFYEKVAYLAQANNHSFYQANHIFSRPDKHQINIPKGRHTIKLISEVSAYLQLNLLENPGYLFPNINGEKITSEYLTQERLKSLANEGYLPSAVRSKMLIAQNNEWKSSGLKLYNMAQNLWKTRKDDISLRNFKDGVKNSFTYFRNLLPTETISEKKLSLDWVVNYSLVDFQKENRAYKFIETQVEELLKDLILGYFIETDSNSSQKITYELPLLNADSELRVIIQQAVLEKPQTLYIQYDNNPPEIFDIYPEKDLSIRAYGLNKGIVGLSILEKNIKQYEQRMATLGGLFTLNHIPGKLYSAGIIITDLPQNTRKIKIWQKEGETPIKFALQYLAPQKTDQDSSVELERQKGIATDYNLSYLLINSLSFFDDSNRKSNNNLAAEAFFNYLIKKQPESSYLIQNKNEIITIYNDWIDLIRLLYERYQKFAVNMNEVEPIFIAPLNKKSTVDNEDLLNAEALSRKNDSEDAIIAWSKVLQNADLNLWRIAHLRRVEALKQAGEANLAEKSLKALILNAKDMQIKKDAYQKLMEFYRERQFYYGLEGLIVAYFLHIGIDENKMEELAEIFIQDDNEQKAIDLASMLKNIKQGELISFTAIKSEVGMQGLRPGEKSETEEEKYFWQAQELQKKGYYQEALKRFNLAGNKGKNWAIYLSEALKIREELQVQDQTTRHAAISKWINWFYNHPGPKKWVKAHYLITNFFDSAILYSNILDLYSNIFIAKDQKPLTLKIQGPTKAQIKFRPILPLNKNLLKIDSWANITIDKNPHFIKVNNSPGSKNLEIVGRNNVSIGTEQIYEFELTQGEHEVVVGAKNLEILVEPLIVMPVLALSALPVVTTETLGFVENHFWQKKENNFATDFGSFELITIIPNQKKYTTRILKFNTESHNLPIDYIDIAGSKKEIKPDYTNVNNKLQAADILYKLLLDYKASFKKELLIRASRICQTNDDDYNINQICNNFDLFSRWRQILSVDSDTKIIIKETDENWDPENSKLNIRKNIMTEEDKDDFIIGGTSILVMDFTNENQTEVKIQAELANLIAKNSNNAILGYQIDGGEVQPIEIKNNITEEKFALDKGKHNLRLFQINPTQETYIKLTLFEKKDQVRDWDIITIKNKRKYFVATKTEPVKLNITSPAWIQVYKLTSEGEETSEDYFIENGQREIVLKAEGQSLETFYRIFEKIPAHPRLANIPPESDINFFEMKEAPFSFELPKRENKIMKISDDLPLQGQADGTMSFSNFFKASTSPDILNNKKEEKEIMKYMEQNIIYRYRDDLNRNYFRSDFIMREFSKAKPSYGVKLSLDHTPRALPCIFFLNGQYFTQRFNDRYNYSLMGEVGLNSSITWTRKLEHVIELSNFIRYSEDKINKVLVNSLIHDPDVYNNYNDLYWKGLNLSYILNYTPWLDTKLWAGVAYRTGIKFNEKDFLNYRIGVDQLINPLVINIDYSFKNYFKNEQRLNKFNRHTINGQLSWEYWLKNKNHRIEANLLISRIFDHDKYSINNSPATSKGWNGSIGITLHLGNGRAYRDFKPNEIKFRALRRKWVPSKNEIRGS